METTEISFKDKRDTILGEFKNFTEKIKKLNFKEAVEECKSFFKLLLNEYKIDEKYLQTKGSDETREGHPISKRVFHYIPEDMAELFVADAQNSNNTVELFNNFTKFHQIWGILGKEKLKIIECSINMTSRFFSHCLQGKNAIVVDKFVKSLNFKNIVEIRDLVSDYNDYFLTILEQRLKQMDFNKAINYVSITSIDKEKLFGYIAKRDDFKKLSFDEMKNIVDRTRSKALARELLSRKDLPIDIFLLKVSIERFKIDPFFEG